MPANCLSLTDRAQILSGIRHNDSCNRIGSDLGVSGSTVSREINRNGGRSNYCAERAERRAARERRRPKVPRLVADPVLAADIEARLKQRDSPMRISIELGQQGVTVSHETIYQAIQRRDRGLKRGLHTYLRCGRKFRKKRGTYGAFNHSLGQIMSIRDRPQEADERTRFGHFEGDLIIGKMNRSAIITVFDRASRLVYLSRPASKSAADVKAALCRLLSRIPPDQRLSLTWDQGAELAMHRQIANEAQIPVYFCDLQSPWQRPTNENGNGLVRHHVGKGTDLSVFTPADLRHIENRINTIPRRIFNWETAQTKYHQLTQ